MIGFEYWNSITNSTINGDWRLRNVTPKVIILIVQHEMLCIHLIMDTIGLAIKVKKIRVDTTFRNTVI